MENQTFQNVCHFKNKYFSTKNKCWSSFFIVRVWTLYIISDRSQAGCPQKKIKICWYPIRQVSQTITLILVMWGFPQIGWSQKKSKLVNALNAQKYILFIKDFCNVKISSISTSPSREDSILIDDPFRH